VSRGTIYTKNYVLKVVLSEKLAYCVCPYRTIGKSLLLQPYRTHGDTGDRKLHRSADGLFHDTRCWLGPMAHGPDPDHASILRRRREFWRAAFRTQAQGGAIYRGAARAPGGR
jgi:hypothetical protein